MKNTISLIVVTLTLLWLGGCSPGYDEKAFLTLEVRSDRFDRIEPVHLTPADPNQAAPSPALTLPAGDKTELTIEQCRALALQNNLNLQVQLFEPQITAEMVTEAKAAFEPLFISQFNYVKTDTPVSQTLDSSQANSLYTTGGLQFPLRTGGQINLSVPFSRYETDNMFSTMNPSYTNDLSLSLSQELLRGAGLAVNTRGIRVQQYEAQRAQGRTMLQAALVLATADRAYWRMYAAPKALEVRRMEYDLTLAQLERARRLVQQKQATEIEVLRAQSAAAGRLENILLADNDLRDRERELKQVLNTPGMDLDSATVLVTTTQPSSVRYVIDHQAMLEQALQNRLDLADMQLQMIVSEINLQVSHNDLLPLLTMDYTYNVNGLGPSSSDAFDLMTENRFVDHRMGLSLRIPLGNQAAQSRYRQALLQKRRLLSNRLVLQTTIKREVLNAIDQMESTWQRVIASNKSAELSLRNLQAEQRLFEQGLQYSTLLLDAQASYADALLTQLRALTEYQIAQVDLCYAIGSINSAARITWDSEQMSVKLEN